MIRAAFNAVNRAYWAWQSASRWRAYRAYMGRPAGAWSSAVATALEARAHAADRAFSFYCYQGGKRS